MQTSHKVSFALTALLILGLSGVPLAAAQTIPGCTLSKHLYTCDRAQFRQALDRAKTIQVDPALSARDRMVAAKLRDLVATLGKAAPAPGEAADLTLSVIPVDSAGVMVGPAGVELAVLRVFAPASAAAGQPSGSPSDASSQGTLLWAESFVGQPDLSWPATVQAAINQFRSGLKR